MLRKYEKADIIGNRDPSDFAVRIDLVEQQIKCLCDHIKLNPKDKDAMTGLTKLLNKRKYYYEQTAQPL